MAYGMREWLRRVHREAAGIDPSNATLDEMEKEVTEGNPQSGVRVDRIRAIRERLLEDSKAGTMGGHRRNERETLKEIFDSK